MHLRRSETFLIILLQFTADCASETILNRNQWYDAAWFSYAKKL